MQRSGSVYTVQRPHLLSVPSKKDRIAVKVINDRGDEVMKVFRVRALIFQLLGDFHK